MANFFGGPLKPFYVLSVCLLLLAMIHFIIQLVGYKDLEIGASSTNDYFNLVNDEWQSSPFYDLSISTEKCQEPQ